MKGLQQVTSMYGNTPVNEDFGALLNVMLPTALVTK